MNHCIRITYGTAGVYLHFITFDLLMFFTLLSLHNAVQRSICFTLVVKLEMQVRR